MNPEFPVTLAELESNLFEQELVSLPAESIVTYVQSGQHLLFVLADNPDRKRCDEIRHQLLAALPGVEVDVIGGVKAIVFRDEPVDVVPTGGSEDVFPPGSVAVTDETGQRVGVLSEASGNYKTFAPIPGGQSTSRN